MSGSVTSNQDFSTGNDCRLVLIMGIIGRVELKHVIGFSASQIIKPLTVSRLNNTPLFKDIPGGWQGDFSLDRGDHTADDLASILEQMYWSGQRLPSGQIYQYISEPDSSTTTWLYDNATLNLANAGSWSQDSTVKQTIPWKSGRRRKV